MKKNLSKISNKKDFSQLVHTSDVSAHVKKSLEKLLDLDKTSTSLTYIDALLLWDQETQMPHNAVESRADQIATIHTLLHKCHTDPSIAELLHNVGVSEETQNGDKNLPPEMRVWLRKKYKQWKKAVSVPPALVSELAKQTSLSRGVWVEARKQNNFSLFAPHLEILVDLKKQYTMCIGYKESPYDVLLHDFEPECTSKYLDKLFSNLQQKLTPLYLNLCEQNKSSPLTQKNMPKEIPKNLHVPIDQQKKFCALLTQHLGYNKNTGTIETSEHPFCVTSGWKDVRITTRYIEDIPLSAIFSTMHEMGHSFYELNISPMYKNTLCATDVSLGIHESQSRFLENIVGRNKIFWHYWHPILCKTCPAFAEENFDIFMRRILEVKKNPIRVESDEVAYNLHIILRFEIEKALFEDTCKVKDLPDMWNKKSLELLDISPKNAREGILQDVHWSEGAFGYFPTYALGNIYASQLNLEMKQALPHYEKELNKGSIDHIINWLTHRVHQYGASKDPKDIFPSLDIDPMISYLKDKYTLY